MANMIENVYGIYYHFAFFSTLPSGLPRWSHQTTHLCTQITRDSRHTCYYGSNFFFASACRFSYLRSSVAQVTHDCVSVRILLDPDCIDKRGEHILSNSHTNIIPWRAPVAPAASITNLSFYADRNTNDDAACLSWLTCYFSGLTAWIDRFCAN